MKQKKSISMNQHKEQLFRKVLQSAQPQLPAADFTAVVMREIEAGYELEQAALPALNGLVKKAEQFKLPADFTARLMDQIEQLPADKIYQPVISKKLGLAIAAIVVAGVSVLSLIGESGSTSSANTKAYEQTMTAIHDLPIFYVLLIMSIAILLVADFVINQRKQNT
jgi:hypothetical protein